MEQKIAEMLQRAHEKLAHVEKTSFGHLKEDAVAKAMVEFALAEKVRKGHRGRPIGSKNKPKVA